jgi:hypothetical protein
VFGGDHAETLEAISNLASTYQSRGKYDEAEQLELEVIEGRKQKSLTLQETTRCLAE